MIRPYSSKDKESIRKLYSDLKYLEPTFSKLDDSHYKKFVYQEKDILGIIILEVSYLTLNIFNIHIDKDNRSEDIGSKFIDFALDYCKKNNLHGVRVSTDSENKSAQSFYLKKGFEKTGEVMNYDVEGEKAVFFYKSVKD